MAPRLSGRLEAERRRRFVGRVVERALFRAAIRAGELPFNVLYVFGPGGVGKTTLLKEYAYACEEAKVRASYVDARDLEPSPDSFLGALCGGFGVAAEDSPLRPLAASGRRVVPGWRDGAGVQAGIPPYSDRAVAATIAYCEYVHERYGRFPANSGPFRTVLAYQAHHLDPDFYDRFYSPETLTDAHRHDHGGA